ncbi:putative UDP-GlcNAc:betaGal beta-1,3-N-acetylglucosaminyltransferase, partial [Stegodyphus mimosarum]
MPKLPMQLLRRIFICLTISAFSLGVIGIFRFGLNSPGAKLIPQLLSPSVSKSVIEFLPYVQRFDPSRVCGSRGLVLVNSAPKNLLNRQIIRETWGHPAVTRSLNLTLAFGFGTSEDTISERQLNWESAVYGDVFHSPFLDTFEALPKKVLSLLNTAYDACPEPIPFIIKVDDDVFVNLFSLGDFITELLTHAQEKKIWCLVWERMPVIRSPESKYSVHHSDFNESTYPTYCSGPAYILSSVALKAILKEFYETEKGDTSFPLEDVYITGILAKASKLLHVQIGTRYAFSSLNEKDVTSGKTIFAHLGSTAAESIKYLWNAVISKKTNVFKKHM